eukprot:TRINITY_DN42201_c0_g1_i1.p1 TRINITY_DN42201_c0_g1~~TRINITY_DN42201_c0_g1_i1.p1  ORF type:complete len:181 (-),score=27.29 TRINITY_DN42201_c0_g1_i1:321-785(-)
MDASGHRSIGLSDAAEQRWRQHLDHPLSRSRVQTRSQEGTARPRSGMCVGAVIPTQELIENMLRDSDALSLPASFQHWVNVPFVPPDGEEWHVLDGFHVRISRAELDHLLGETASESEGEYVDSQAETSVGDSDVDEDGERMSDTEEWSNELGA